MLQMRVSANAKPSSASPEHPAQSGITRKKAATSATYPQPFVLEILAPDDLDRTTSCRFGYSHCH